MTARLVVHPDVGRIVPFNYNRHHAEIDVLKIVVRLKVNDIRNVLVSGGFTRVFSALTYFVGVLNDCTDVAVVIRPLIPRSQRTAYHEQVRGRLERMVLRVQKRVFNSRPVVLEYEFKRASPALQLLASLS